MSDVLLPLLIPAPRRVTARAGEWARSGPLTAWAPPEWRAALADAIQGLDGSNAEPSKGWTDNPDAADLRVTAQPGGPEEYRLRIAPDGVTLSAATPAGAFRGLSTLRQIARGARDRWPACEIDDAPAFEERGVLLDISRDRVPTRETLFALADQFAELKFNRLELYTEHTFAYTRHPEGWAGADPMTPEDIRALDAYCAARFMELVPNQNSFGHLERWLKHPRYRPLAECPDGWVAPWGPGRREPMTLNPGDPESQALIRDWYDELLPNFRSRKLNVGADETWELGQGHSRRRCETEGKGRVYLDFLLVLHRLCAERGRIMHFWGDIIGRHPELIPALPRDAVPMAWGYEADHPFDTEAARFAETGLRYFVCPGTSSWNALAGRTRNALANLRTAAQAGRRHGAAGYLVTDWGDGGHWQPLAVSFLPWAAAAEHAWRGEEAADNDAILRACALQVFGDPSARFTRAAARLGDVHERVGAPVHNAAVLFRLLSPRPDERLLAGITAEALAGAEAELRDLRAELSLAPCARPDAGLIREELDFAARGLLLGCARARALLDRRAPPGFDAELAAWMDTHRRLWLARHRPGGLADSLARMAALRAET